MRSSDSYQHGDVEAPDANKIAKEYRERKIPLPYKSSLSTCVECGVQFENRDSNIALCNVHRLTKEIARQKGITPSEAECEARQFLGLSLEERLIKMRTLFPE